MIIRKLLPQEDRSVYLKWILVGLLIRLALMPFTIHGDIVGRNWTAYFLTYQGYLPSHYMHHPPLAYYIMSFFQFLFKPVMPFYGDSPYSAGHWTNGPYVFRFLFLLKSYYLFFDFGAAFLLLRLIDGQKKRLLAFKFWILNPVIIFVTYIHGQFDILPTFFLTLSLYYTAKNRLVRSFFWLGIGAAIKNFLFLYLVPSIILLGKGKIEKLKLLLWATVPYLALIYPYLGKPGSQDIGVWSGQSQRILDFEFNLGDFDRVYVFIIGYTIISVFTYIHDHASNGKVMYERVWRVELMVSLWLYITVLFHPQWFVWIMPLLTLFILENKRLITLYWLLVICFFVYTFRWGRGLFGRLFMPIDPVFFSKIKSPAEFIVSFYPYARFIHIFRSIFAGVLIWMMYEVYRILFPRKETGKKEA
ncbi:MAG: hypothetical protein ACE5K3_03315 [bacterium]